MIEIEHTVELERLAALATRLETVASRLEQGNGRHHPCTWPVALRAAERCRAAATALATVLEETARGALA